MFAGDIHKKKDGLVTLNQFQCKGCTLNFPFYFFYGLNRLRMSSALSVNDTTESIVSTNIDGEISVTFDYCKIRLLTVPTATF